MPYCSNCGKELSNENGNCPACGYPININMGNSSRISNFIPGPDLYYRSRKINNHLTKAILATIFCCIPFGIVAIIYAASVNGKIEAGKFFGAQIASDKANSWANWSIGIGLIVGIIYLIAALAGGM